MAPSPKYQKILILVLPLLCQSLPHPSSASGGGATATSHQEYEEWLRWNVQNQQQWRHTRNNNKNTHDKYYLQAAKSEGATISDSVAVAKSKAVKSEDNVVLDVKLQLAEMNQTHLVVNPTTNGTGTGGGDFRTISEALDRIPLYNSRRVIIKIRPGLYREKIYIPKTKAFITLMGDPANPPIITGNDTASVTGADGTLLKTFHSATVAVDADYFIALNIVFQNTAGHEIGRLGEQGVAVRISGNKAAFYSCSFYGSQDTLYDHRGLHYFQDCFIQGSVDFIFGYARSLYQNCTLNSMAKKVASVTAQKRSRSSMSSGFSFKDCKVTGSGMVYLGRAWGDFSRVVFSYSFLDNLVLPQGWSDWAHPSRNLSVYYGEYKCSGPGSNMTGRVPWARALTDEEAEPFIGPHYVEADTWLITPSA